MKTKIMAAVFSTSLIAFLSLVTLNINLKATNNEAPLSNTPPNQVLSEFEKIKKGDEKQKLCRGMFHFVTYSAQNTRSEARHGYVEIEGYVVPDVFTCLSYKNKGVTFLIRSNLWGDDGYWPSVGVDLPEEFGPPLTEKERTKGWRVSQKTPSNLSRDWVFVKWPKGSAFVSAKRLKEFVKTMSLSTIAREGMEKSLREMPSE